MKKLSEQFLEMSHRTAAWETRTAAVNEQNRRGSGSSTGRKS
jgi:hypothetical protein